MTDFGAVVAELRLFHHNVAADAVEALVAENEVAERGIRIAAHRVFELRGERDALQQQLDGMTTEWEIDNLGRFADLKPERVQKMLVEGHVIASRLVGPWTPVEEKTDE